MLRSKTKEENRREYIGRQGLVAEKKSLQEGMFLFTKGGGLRGELRSENPELPSKGATLNSPIRSPSWEFGKEPSSIFEG